MSQKLRVVFVTPEIPPFSKSGQLAEFSAALPPRLSGLGVDVSVVVPRYRTPEGGLLETVPIPGALSVPMDGDAVKASVFLAEGRDFPLYLIDHPKYFLRDKVYGPAGAGYLDNDERFIFFSRAVMELLLRFDPPADVIHCHDWPTALIPVFLKTHYLEAPALKRAASVLTIHSAAEQGEFPPESLAWTGLNWDFFNHGRLNLNGKFNFLKAGIAYSDLVNAGGASVGRALLTDKDGRGLAGVLRQRGGAFAGITGGTGPDSWEETARDYIGVYEKALKIKRGD
jgi:starch synthase